MVIQYIYFYHLMAPKLSFAACLSYTAVCCGTRDDLALEAAIFIILGLVYI